MGFLKYPGLEKVEAEVGQVSHTNKGTLMFLYATTDGLQAFASGDDDRGAATTNTWVPPRPDCLVVNVGDSLRLLSGRKFKPCLHHMVPHANAVGKARYSSAFFLVPSETALLGLGDGWICTRWN
ncbi:hypothetical protein PG993_008582 [Apiospora rasikravindrae]|uniref:Fe2OG dioxygenase domain-containing protein n=1 Tax=Apiospora rasikravindrae TaxID=990691 RepID=A0ABR1T0R8_9PEZI